MKKITLLLLVLLTSMAAFAQDKELKTSKEAKDAVVVKGQVFHLDTHEPLGVKLFYYDLGQHEELGSSNSDPTDGHYHLVLQYGHHYGIGAELKGYLPVFEELHLVDEMDVHEVYRNIYMAPLKKGEIIPLTNVHFTPDGKKLKPMSFMALDVLVRVLKEHPTMKIEIKGLEHFGKAGYTEEHALRSAVAIQKYLKKKKIGKDRVSVSAVKETEVHVPSDFQEIFEVELLIKEM
ncbi:MAG: OmpA family protein [Flammeovirgaceae bacterium]